jgi:hypothetical protein
MLLRKVLIVGTLVLSCSLTSHARTVITREGGKASDSSRVCYSQAGSRDGVVVSQNFADDTVDTSQAADDFILTSLCTIRRVAVEGEYFRGFGPGASVAVTVYDDSNGKPGAIVPAGDESSNRYSDPSQNGDLSVSLRHSLELPPGKYWISVAVNMAYRAGGEWGWETMAKRIGSSAKWRNPNNGFGTGCKVYTNLRTCLGRELGSLLIFTIFR